MSPLEIATTFATALDCDDYETAASVIHPDCVYTIGDKTIHGRDAIIDSYRNASIAGRKTFDKLEFDSRVTMKDDSRAVIDFFDILTHRGKVHHHRCQQFLTIAGGAVTAIEHHDLPGEREAIAEFKRSVGIEAQ